ncbi:ropporin-1-like protein [Chelonus insularis]|uniref:ropporin-1-like protein n=1 Tax=Chelonus insularis TaxID=460826 RepID=UPI00158BFF6E|nr:ropporin-1-like protein [Chelonus insularis]
MSMGNNDLTVNSLNVPEKLPVILKQFCKAAIRTQPYDLLKWSCAYFNALAKGSEPPTKIRLEYPLPRRSSSLTIGLLKVLLRQFGDYHKSLPLEVITRQWNELCLDQRDLNLILIIGRFRRKCLVKKFLAIAVGLLGANLFDTMLMICELFTMEPDGGSAMIPLSLFTEIYEYLAKLHCDGGTRDQNDDPFAFIIEDTENLKWHSVDNSNKNFINSGGISNSTNLDTEEDANFDLDSLSKDDSLSIRRNFVKEETIDAVIDVDKLQKKDNTSESATTIRNSDSLTITNGNRSNFKQKSIETNQNFNLDPKWVSHYPIIPGIGPRLTVEEITAVIEWVTECANVQEGMIGPRNLRHFQCPPLDRQDMSKFK